MAFITAPDFAIKSIRLNLDQPSQSNMSQWTGKRTVVTDPWHSKWRANVELATQQGEDGYRLYRAFFVNLNGTANTFRLYATAGAQNENTGVSLAADASATATTLTIADYDTPLLAGQFFTLNGQLCCCTEDQSSATLTFKPALRQDATAGTTVVTSRPYMLAYLASSEFGYDIGSWRRFGMTFDVVEAIMETDGTAPEPAPTPPTIDAADFAALYDVSDLSTLFQDSFGMTPVSSAGQSVGLILSKSDDGTTGSDLYAGASASVGSGWAWNSGTKTGTATAASSVLRLPHPNDGTDFRYVVQATVTVTSGSLEVYVGAAGSALRATITTSGTYKLHLREGGATDAGTYFNGVGFTGTVVFTSTKKESIYPLFQETSGARGVYGLDANSKARVRAGTSSYMTTIAKHTLAVNTYLAVGMARASLTSATLFNFGNNGLQITSNTGELRLSAGSNKSGAQASPGTRVAGSVLNSPTALDIYLTAGTTSIYQDGGTRDVPDTIGLAAGEQRAIANTWSGGDSYASSAFSINATGDGTTPTAGDVDFYAGVIRRSTITEDERQNVADWLRYKMGSWALDQRRYVIFPVAGQSNAMGASGAGAYTSSTACPFGEGVEYIDSGFIRSIIDPTQHSYPSQTSLDGSMWPAFCKAFYDNGGGRACISGSAWSGEGLVNPVISDGSWLNGETLTDHLVAKLNTAKADLPGSSVGGVVYMGGEQDSTLGFTQAQYRDYLIAFRDKLRTKTGISDLKLLLISLDNSATNSSNYAIMRAAMVDATAYEGIYLIASYQNYLSRGSGWNTDPHLTQQAYNDYGAIAGAGAAAVV